MNLMCLIYEIQGLKQVTCPSHLVIRVVTESLDCLFSLIMSSGLGHLVEKHLCPPQTTRIGLVQEPNNQN